MKPAHRGSTRTTRSWSSPRAVAVRGKANIQAMRTAYPASLAFADLRTIGSGDVWVNQYTISYDGRPSHVVGIMEFRDGLVVRETIYISDSWEPPAWRAEWVESIVSPAG